MTRLLLLGAGKIGGTVATFLADTGDYRVTVADQDRAALDRLQNAGIEKTAIDTANAAALGSMVGDHEIVVSALPYYLNAAVAEAARAGRTHYFDLTEDVETTHRIRAIAEGADTAFVPQCGLAPGFVSIVAYDLASRFELLRDVHMRVGALPLYPVNALRYNLTWSTDGLINEYCNPCEAIHNGKKVEVLALEGLEHFSLDGVRYEAFNTSGGLGTLCDTLDGKVRSLNYKTVRYPGHRDMAKMLIGDLGLGERRDVFRDILETSIPVTRQDLVLVFATVAGVKDGRLTQESYARKIYHGEVDGHELSAIQITTASGVCAMVDLLCDGKLPEAGFVCQEQAALDAFLENRFGRNYAPEQTKPVETFALEDW